MPGNRCASARASTLPVSLAPVTINCATPASRARSSTWSRSWPKDSWVRLAPISIRSMRSAVDKARQFNRVPHHSCRLAGVHEFAMPTRYAARTVDSGGYPHMARLLSALLLACLFSIATPARAFTPESGWWWSPGYPGIGFSLEIQDDFVFMVAFSYEDGGATWYAAQGNMADNA